MQHDWIFDVLADLRCFSDLNGLSALSRQLDMTATVARAEIAAALAAGEPLGEFHMTARPPFPPDPG